VQRTTGMGKHR